MSRLTSTLMNAVPRVVLASPAHRLMSRRYATLHFTGRRSGRRYHLPIAYIECDRGFVMSTDSGWWRNLADGTPFTVTLQGTKRRAAAKPIAGEAAVDALHELVTVPGYAKAAGIPSNPSDTDLERAATQRVVLKVELDGQP